MSLKLNSSIAVIAVLIISVSGMLIISESSDGEEITVTDENSLRDAFSSLSSGDYSITLGNNITVEGVTSIIIPQDASVSLDLKKFSIETSAMFSNKGTLKISGNTNDAGVVSTIAGTNTRTVYNAGVLVIESGVTLTNNNSSIGAACVYNAGNAAIYGNLAGTTRYTLYNTNTVVVDGTDIINTYSPGYAVLNEGNIRILNSTIQGYSGIYNASGTMTIDADVTGMSSYAILNSGPLYVIGGTYKSSNENPISDINIDPELGTSGSTQVLGGDHYNITHDTTAGLYQYALDEEYVAVSINGVVYPDFPSAIADAEEGQTITLEGDVSTYPICIEKGVVIDLGEYDLTVDNFGFTESIGLTFVSGTSKIIGSGSIIDNRPVDDASREYTTITVMGVGTELTVQSKMTSYAPLPSGYNDLIQVIEGGALVLEGAELKQSVDEVTRAGLLLGVTVFGNGLSASPSKFTVYEGTSIVVSGYAINGNGSIPPSDDYRYTDIIINGGHVESTDSTAIYNPQVGTLTIAGGEIIGLTAIEVRSGTLNISGDPVITGNYPELMLNSQNPGNGNTVYGVALAISQHSTRQDIEVIVSGGNFSGAYAIYEVFLIDQDESRSNITMDITGGTFTGVTSATTSEGYEYGFGSVNTTNVDGFIFGGTYRIKAADGTVAADSRIPTDYLGQDVSLENGVAIQRTYEVKFTAPSDMTITVQGEKIPGMVEAVGGSVVSLPAGSYTYFTSSAGYVTQTGSFKITIDSELVTIEISVELVVPTITGPIAPEGDVEAPHELSVVANHGFTDAEFIYQWYDSNGVIEGANSRTYNVQASGTYYVEVIASHGDYVSDTAVSETVAVSIATPQTTVDYDTDVEGNVTATMTIPEDNNGNVVIDVGVIRSVIDNINQLVDIGSDSEKVIRLEIQSSLSVDIPVESMQSLIENDIMLVVSSDAGIMAIEPDVAMSIIQQTSDAETLTVLVTDADKEQMEPEQIEIVGSCPVFELSIMINGEPVTRFDGRITVELEWSIPDNVDASDIVVFHIDDGGNIEAMPTDCSSGNVVFQTTHFSYYFIGDISMVFKDEPVPPSENPGWIPDQDDDVWIPPTIVYEEADSTSDATSVVACAAAAVVAALMAAFLIIERRKN